MSLHALIDDLKNINPKNPGGWPWPVKSVALTGLFLFVVLGGAVLDWQGEWERLANARQEEDRLKEQFLAKKKQAVSRDIIERQLTEARQSFGALLKQLPDKSEMDALLTDINQAGLGRGLQFELFRPGAEVITGVFAEQPIMIKVTGNYDDLGKFASDISQLPRIVTLNDISVARAPVPAGTPATANVPLVMETLAKTFRYLDDAELAARKKAAGPGKSGKPAAQRAK